MTAKILLAVLVAISTLLVPELAGAATTFAGPKFLDYPAAKTSIENISEPRLETAKDREYRSSILGAAHKGRVNFAGHYIFSVVGCGSSCSMAFILDAKDGSIYWLPFTVSYAEKADKGFGNEFYAFDFRTDSNLLVIQGSRNELNDDGLYDYVFGHGLLQLVKSQPYPLKH